MPKFFDMVNPFSKKNPATGFINKHGKDLLFGTPEVRENVSTLRPEQEPLLEQAIGAGNGAFGSAADYYRNNLSDNPQDFQSFAAPALRQYNEEIVPGLSEQFAGMGSGGLSSSGFRNAQVQGATDLSERLGALRAQLRQQSAQGLMNIGQIGLGNYSQNMVTEHGTSGLLPSLAPAAGAIAGGFLGGPAGAAAGYGAGSAFGNSFGSSSPYGNSNGAASPQGRF